MKMLLWKDYRQMRPVLIFGALLLAAPYVMLLYTPAFPNWQSQLQDAAGFSLLLSLLTCALLGGTSMAAERGDRSAEFLAGLPIRRLYGLLSKLILCLAAYGAIVLITMTVALPLIDRVQWPAYFALSMIAMLILGIAWLCSSFMDSTPIATAVGIAVPSLMGVSWAMIMLHWDIQVTDQLTALIFATLGLVGLLNIAAGCVIYLRRVQP